MVRKPEPTIMFVKPGAVSADDRATLLEAGIIVVQIDDPQAVKLVRAGVEVEAGALLNAAARAIKESEHSQKAFAIAVANAIELQFKARQY